MRVIYKNIIRNIVAHPKSNLIILINMMLCTATLFVLLQNYFYLKNHFDEVYDDNNIARHYYIQMTEKDMQSKLSDILNHSPMYYVGKQVDEEIMKNPHLDMYYFSEAYLTTEIFKNPEQINDFRILDENAYEMNQLTGQEIPYYYINAMMVSENIDQIFNLKIMEGRVFNSEDKNITDLSIPVPVILGNDYKTSFNVGDIIELNGDSLIVIGILEDNMYFSVGGSVEYLDNRIFTLNQFPRIQTETDDTYSLEKNQIYEYIFCDDSGLDLQKEINRITAENGYYTYEVLPIDGVEITETKSVSEKNVLLIGLLALIAGSICATSLGTILYNRSIQDRSVNCIYLCCGIPLWKINISLVLEMAIFLFISLFPTYALSIYEYGELLVPFWQILLFSGIVVIITLIPTMVINHKSNLDLLIRDKIV